MTDSDPHAKPAGAIAWRAFFTTLAYAAVLHYAYQNYVSPTYAYEHLSYRTPSWDTYSLVILITAGLAAVLPNRITHPSDFVVWLVFIVVGAPTILLPQYMTLLTVGEATRLGLVVAGCLLMIRVLAAARPSFTGDYLPRVPSSTVWGVMAGLALAVYALLIATSGISLHWLALTDVYSTRADFAENTATIPILGYLLPVVYTVINPAFIARGLYNHRWSWAVAGVGGQMVIYMTTGIKSALFAMAAIFALYLLFRRNPNPRGSTLLLAASSIAFIGIALDKIFHTVLWNSILVRRSMIIPGALAVAYVAVFKDRPKGNFFGTPIFWQDPVYVRGPSYIVGQFLTGNPLNNANVGLFGHGYFNYGYIGIFIEAFVLVVLLWLTDIACKGLPLGVVAMVIFQSASSASTASIFTTMLSHGYLPGLIILALLPRTGWGNQRSSVPALQLSTVSWKNRM